VAESAGAAEVPQRREPWHRHLQGWLANPLLVTVVSAMLVYLVIPQLTRGWQNHQKILDVKTALVGDMSDSAGKAVMSGRFVASGLIGKATPDPFATQRAFNDAYQTWTTTSAVIGSRLAAYFTDGDLSDRWRSYASVLADYLQIGVTGPAAQRSDELIRIARHFPSLHRGTAGRPWWQALLDRAPADAFQQNYAELGNALLAERDVLVQDVLRSRASGI
jgi:hypothetical protein